MLAQLLDLSCLLATGTTRQKQHAWQALLSQGCLWRGCEEAVQTPDSVRSLERAYQYLSGDWDRSPVVEACLGDSQCVEERTEAACRILAAAAVASLAVTSRDASRDLQHWGFRALGDRNPVQVTHEIPAWQPRENGAELVRYCFGQLLSRMPQRTARIASAQSTVLSILAGSPQYAGSLSRIHQVRCPVLLARGGKGYIVWLWLERLAGGYGEFFQAANTLFDPLQPDLKLAIDDAWQMVAERQGRLEGEDVRWWLGGVPWEEHPQGGRPAPLEGCSLQGAAYAGLLHLLRNQTPHPTCVVAATVRPNRTLGHVAGFEGSAPKLEAALRLANRGEMVTVITGPENRPAETIRRDWEARGLRLEIAETADEAAELALLGHDVRSRHAPQPLPNPVEPKADTDDWKEQEIVLLGQPGSDTERVAAQLASLLRSQGCRVQTRTPVSGVGAILAQEQAIHRADLVLPLVSAATVHSEMLAYTVQVALEAAQHQGRPRVLPVWLTEPTGIQGVLVPLVSDLPSLRWSGSAERVAGEIRDALRNPGVLLSSQWRRELTPPTGVLPLESRFYVPRDTDELFAAAIDRQDSIVRIKGARQMGKTSLLARGLSVARAQGKRVLLTDFQVFNRDQLESVDGFFRALARSAVRQLNLDVSPDEVWDPLHGPSWNFREFFCYEIMERIEEPLVWGLDEVDRLFTSPFGSEVFGLFRSWHNERALNPMLPWSRLTLALAYATEAHLFITDLNQSPFNVGTRIALRDFSLEQIQELNARYGGPLQDSREEERYWELLGGHPYLSHRGLHELASQGRTLAELERLAEQEDSVFGDHLGHMLLLVLKDPELAEVMRGVLQGRPCPTPESYFRLWSAGLLTGLSPRDARPRCRLYATYLERHLL